MDFFLKTVKQDPNRDYYFLSFFYVGVSLPGRQTPGRGTPGVERGLEVGDRIFLWGNRKIH